MRLKKKIIFFLEHQSKEKQTLLKNPLYLKALVSKFSNAGSDGKDLLNDSLNNRTRTVLDKETGELIGNFI